MIKAGIVGAAGYTGGEALRLLALHPGVELVFAQSESQAGKKIHDVHPDCYGLTSLEMAGEISREADVWFMCKGHGESKKFLENNSAPSGIKLIDLSQDFRLKKNAHFNGREFVYGLPEMNREKIRTAHSVANPGCFATAIQLALLPLAEKRLLKDNVHISATTGSTGAGQAFSATTHFSWRSNNHSAYKIMEHQHENEITESLENLQKGFDKELFFVPQRGAFSRGIYSVAYINRTFELENIKKLYQDYYASHPFTHLVDFDIDVKQVANTNQCFISLQVLKGQLVIISAIDNMLKGAAGQAVQNMNLMFGLEENTGLKLKPSAF